MRFAVFASVLFLAPIAPAQRIVTVAGLGPSHRAEVDGREALDAPLDQVYGLLLSPSSGRLLIHDEQLVERLEPDGTLLAVAGAINWRNGSTADGTPASALGLLALRGMAEDASGALYLADAAVGRIYRVRDGIATTFAAMPSPRGLVFDAQGNLIVAEASCRCIRRVTPDGHGSTVYALPDTQPVRYFEGVALDRSGNIYATEYAGDEVLKIAADGAATTIAGPKDVNGPSGVAVAPDGTVYIADTKNNRILRVAADGSISTVAGAEEGFDWPAQVISAPDGSLYVSEYRKRRVRRIDANGGITTIAGSGTLSRAASGDPGDGGPAIYANVSGASAALFDAAGNLLVAESFASRVRRIAPDQTITTLAAVPVPYGLATDPFGGLYIAGGDDRVRRVDPDGTISVHGRPGGIGGRGVPCDGDDPGGRADSDAARDADGPMSYLP